MKPWSSLEPLLHGDFAGLLLNIGAAFLYSIVALIAKLAQSAGVPTFQLVFFRSIVLVAIPFLWARIPIYRPSYPLTLLISRACIGILAMVTSMASVKFLPLDDAVLLGFLAPVFTVLLGYIFLRERISRVEVAGFALCFLGFLFIARPAFLFGRTSPREPTEDRLLGVALACFSSLCSAIAYVLTRRIGQSASSLVVVTYMGYSGLLMSPVLGLLVEGTSWVFSGSRIWVLLVLVALIAYLAQILLVVSLQIGTAGRVSVGQYTQTIFAIIWSVLFLSQYPSSLTVLGLLCIGTHAGISAYQGWRSVHMVLKEGQV